MKYVVLCLTQART